MHIFESIGLLSQKLLFGFFGLLGLGFLIGFHELGHFLFCKLFGINTPSFSIGFGPRIFTKKIGQTEFKLSAIPFGGYVEIAGSSEMGQGEQSHAHSRASDSFAVKPFWQKLLVMLGGIICNLLFAYVAFILLFALGTPKSALMYKTSATPVVAQVIEDRPAYTAGILTGDRLVAINNVPLNNSIEPFLTAMENSAQQVVNLSVLRKDQLLEIPLTADSVTNMGKTTGSLGIVFELQEGPSYPLLQAIQLGIKETHNWIFNTFKGFVHIFHKRDVSEMAGPLMIVSMTMKGAAQGFKIFLLFLAIISINLAVLNLIPLPILDGGQILFYSIEAIMGRPLPERVREYIHIATWLAFIVLFVYLSFMDITRLFQPTIETIRAYFSAPTP